LIPIGRPRKAAHSLSAKGTHSPQKKDKRNMTHKNQPDAKKVYVVTKSAMDGTSSMG
jgi:hypothetical protein